MKKLLLFICFLHCSILLVAQRKPFRFVHISDTHIGSPSGSAEEDLRQTIADINSMSDIPFVVITGDITELGTDAQLRLARQLLDELKVPYYIIPGNHDACWSESGGVSFARVFGYDKFQFDYQGIRFLGCPSGPYVRMSDGHIPRDAIVWLDKLLDKTSPDQPLIFFNHYPIDSSLDNWYNITDRLRNYNTLMIGCGHGHGNRQFNFDDIPGVMGRSNLRVKDATGGYNLVDVGKDTITYSERRPGVSTLSPWARVPIKQHKYDKNKKFYRPNYLINDRYPQVKEKWIFSSDANVISTPAHADGLVIFGNQQGTIQAVNLQDGKKKWSYSTGGSIFSSGAISSGNVVLGSGDGYVYCIQTNNGALKWKLQTGAAVLGSPVIEKGVAYIGSSDHIFRAIDMNSGKIIWKFEGLEGPVVSTPLLYEESVIFGAWDNHLYCLAIADGMLQWKWDNGSPIINYSPASCIPVANDSVVYVVAPDRYMTAIDFLTGQTLWRNNESTVRESIGISADGKWVYGKTMKDTIVAFPTGREKPTAAWKMDCGFGYEHVPSMLIEKEKELFFGTRLGVVYALDAKQQHVLWAHKIDNSMVNTVSVLDKFHVLAATMDGKVSLLEIVK